MPKTSVHIWWFLVGIFVFAIFTMGFEQEDIQEFCNNASIGSIIYKSNTSWYCVLFSSLDQVGNASSGGGNLTWDDVYGADYYNGTQLNNTIAELSSFNCTADGSCSTILYWSQLSGIGYQNETYIQSMIASFYEGTDSYNGTIINDTISTLDTDTNFSQGGTSYGNITMHNLTLKWIERIEFVNQSIQIGVRSEANTTTSTCVGAYCKAGYQSTAIGYSSDAWYNGFAGGAGAQARKEGGTAIGVLANAAGTDCTAIGRWSYCNNSQSIALARAIAKGLSCISLGDFSYCDSQYSFAAGVLTNVTGDYGIGIGYGNKASKACVSIGRDSECLADWSYAAGYRAIADGLAATSIGPSTYSTDLGVGIGWEANASGTGCVAIGPNSTCNAVGAVAVGVDVYNDVPYSVKFGNGTCFIHGNKGNINCTGNITSERWFRGSAYGDNVPLDFFPQNDEDDFLEMRTESNEFRLTAKGSDMNIHADGGDIIFDDENIHTTGVGYFGDQGAPSASINRLFHIQDDSVTTTIQVRGLDSYYSKKGGSTDEDDAMYGLVFANEISDVGETHGIQNSVLTAIELNNGDVGTAAANRYRSLTRMNSYQTSGTNHYGSSMGGWITISNSGGDHFGDLYGHLVEFYDLSYSQVGDRYGYYLNDKTNNLTWGFYQNQSARNQFKGWTNFSSGVEIKHNLTVKGTIAPDTYLADAGKPFNFYENTDDVILNMSAIAGNNYFGVETDGAFLQLYSNPNPSIDYLLFTVSETQGADTEVNFYEGGTGHNRFWDSGSARFGGSASSTCSPMAQFIDCDTPNTGADVAIQDQLQVGRGAFFGNGTYNISDSGNLSMSGNIWVERNVTVLGNVTTKDANVIGRMCWTANCSSFTYHNGTHLIIKG